VAWLTASGSEDGGIDRIYWVLNPANLERIAAAVLAGPRRPAASVGSLRPAARPGRGPDL